MVGSKNWDDFMGERQTSRPRIGKEQQEVKVGVNKCSPRERSSPTSRRILYKVLCIVSTELMK